MAHQADSNVIETVVQLLCESGVVNIRSVRSHSHVICPLGELERSGNDAGDWNQIEPTPAPRGSGR